MFNFKKTVALTVSSLAAIGCVTIGASAMSSPNSTSGSVQFPATSSNELSTHHEYPGGGEWWWDINFLGWASSDYQHHNKEHASSVKGATYCDSHWKYPGEMASSGSYRNLTGTTYCNWRTK